MNAFCNSKEDKNGYLLSIINNFHIHSRDFFLFFYKKAISIMRVIFNFILDYFNRKENDLV